MDIELIKPYERNARKNEKAIPVVAESIKEFGFKGQIVLRSREDPTIVNGHTRVAACKLLGWTDFPDEYIAFAEDLTDDQVKALRLADNKTAQIATWNKGLLKSEVRALKKSDIDMSKFNFDYKSEVLPYGNERMKTVEGYNLDICNVNDCAGEYGMPVLEPCNETPNKLLPFNYAKSATDTDCWLHFFVDDYQFERLWNSPRKYLDLVGRFNGVLSPDFSLYMDMPLPMQQWNEYRRRALSRYWQGAGISVIPTLSWSTPDTYGFCFSGIPRHSTVAVSTVGVMRDESALEVWRDGMSRALDTIEPDRVVAYGGKIEGFDFGCEVVTFKANTTRFDA